MARGLTAIVFVLGTLAVWPSQATPGEASIADDPRPEARSQIELLERATWRLERLMGKRRTTARELAESESVAAHLEVLAFWQGRYGQVLRMFRKPPRLEDWLCIHDLEAPWDDPDPPYYGGLQMEISFQRRYGSELLKEKGTADNWTPLEQIWVAVRAYRVRGFEPWPNAARECGLLKP
jgi:hypothetical protein